MKKLFLFGLLLSSCFGERVYRNITIINKSNSYIVDIFGSDTIGSNELIYRIIKNKSLAYNISTFYPTSPKSKGYICAMGNWKVERKNDTTLVYLYLVNLNIIDSLNKIDIDTLTIKRLATTIIKTSCAQLNKEKWEVTYKYSAH